MGDEFQEFAKDLTKIINARGIDNVLDIPDWVLSNYVVEVLRGLKEIKEICDSDLVKHATHVT